MRFVDTNILLYAVSRAPAEEAKSRIARGLLERTDLALSVQVLQEFYVQATRATKQERISHPQAVALIEAWMRFPVQEMTAAVLLAALSARERFQMSYWDAAILESARTLGCREVYSEDLSAGRSYGGIRVVNPFA